MDTVTFDLEHDIFLRACTKQGKVYDLGSHPGLYGRTLHEVILELFEKLNDFDVQHVEDWLYKDYGQTFKAWTVLMQVDADLNDGSDDYIDLEGHIKAVLFNLLETKSSTLYGAIATLHMLSVLDGYLKQIVCTDTQSTNASALVKILSDAVFAFYPTPDRTFKVLFELLG